MTPLLFDILALLQLAKALSIFMCEPATKSKRRTPSGGESQFCQSKLCEEHLGGEILAIFLGAIVLESANDQIRHVQFLTNRNGI
jgi:hypothetical protein